MSFWTYMLRYSDGRFYVGHSDDLERRIGQHQSGEFEGYTSTRLPVELVWAEDVGTRVEAIAFELQLKGWSRAKKEALIERNWDRVSLLAKKSFDTGLRQAQPLLRTNGVGEERMPHTPPPPAIVLVRPQLAENIGKAARAMLNFGLTDLRLVAPRDGWPNPDAGPAAAGADSVIASARVFGSVADAVVDRAHVYATTVRKRGVTKPVVDPEAAAQAMRVEPGGSAILFGPERAGLESDDVAIARTILTVPINPDFGSLNLAQAVALVAYEWGKGASLAQPPLVAIEPAAPQGELERLVDQLDAMLDHAGFYFPPDKVQTSKRMIRSIMTKPGWSAHEVRTLRGVLTALANPRPKA